MEGGAGLIRLKGLQKCKGDEGDGGDCSQPLFFDDDDDDDEKVPKDDDHDGWISRRTTREDGNCENGRLSELDPVALFDLLSARS